jgi:Protein of unknown function (DUF3465)
VWITVAAPVVRLLPDEYGRLQHQRFIIRCQSGQTVLIVNDVTLGQRVPVQRGAFVVVRGRYVWNSQGGLIHFTHHDSGPGTGGWILLDRRIYASLNGKRSRVASVPTSGWSDGSGASGRPLGAAAYKDVRSEVLH